MLVNSILFIFLILFSLGLFFINNLYIIISFLIVGIILSIVFKVRLPIKIPFIIILIISFTLNYLLSSIDEAILVTTRLITMFIVVNLIVKKIGILNIGKIIGKLFHSRDIELIITIGLSFLPILAKEIYYIKNSLKTKNFPLNFKNILTKPHIFVITFFNNLFKRVNDMEKVFISRGIDE